jgi:hypothetical protein
MANLAATDITYTVKNLRTLGNSKKHNRIQLAFGDGALTYPTGGIPVTASSLGCPNAIESLVIVEQGTSGYKFQFDTTNTKLIMTYTGAHVHNLLIKNNVVADAAGTRVNIAANVFGANSAGGDVTVAGGGANGGVVSTTIGAGSEASAVAIAAQTIIVEVIGW